MRGFGFIRIDYIAAVALKQSGGAVQSQWCGQTKDARPPIPERIKHGALSSGYMIEADECIYISYHFIYNGYDSLLIPGSFEFRAR